MIDRAVLIRFLDRYIVFIILSCFSLVRAAQRSAARSAAQRSAAQRATQRSAAQRSAGQRSAQRSAARSAARTRRILRISTDTITISTDSMYFNGYKNKFNGFQQSAFRFPARPGLRAYATAADLFVFLELRAQSLELRA